MSDRIAVLSGGRVEQYDSPENIYDQPETAFVARFVGSSNWIDEHHMFRPEKAALEHTESAKRFDTRVSSVQFLGNTYQIQLKYGKQIWNVLSGERMSVGADMPIYIKEKHVITL